MLPQQLFKLLPPMTPRLGDEAGGVKLPQLVVLGVPLPLLMLRLLPLRLLLEGPSMGMQIPSTLRTCGKLGLRLLPAPLPACEAVRLAAVTRTSSGMLGSDSVSEALSLPARPLCPKTGTGGAGKPTLNAACSIGSRGGGGDGGKGGSPEGGGAAWTRPGKAAPGRSMPSRWKAVGNLEFVWVQDALLVSAGIGWLAAEPRTFTKRPCRRQRRSLRLSKSILSSSNPWRRLLEVAVSIAQGHPLMAPAETRGL